MQAVILAAGRGSRLAPLTDKTPKPLIEIAGVPILERLIRSLPSEIVDIIIVIDYLGEQIKNHFDEEFEGRKIIYVEQGSMTGTYGALFSAKKYLAPGKFLVLGSDDIFNTDELSQVLKHDLAFGVHTKFLPGKEWLIVECLNGYVKGLRRPTDEEFQKPQRMATGVYLLDERFWKYKPFQLINGEYGLPQTLREMFSEELVSLVEMRDWLQINTHEELAYAESHFGQEHI